MVSIIFPAVWVNGLLLWEPERLAIRGDTDGQVWPPGDTALGLLAQLFPDSLFFFSKHFCELLGLEAELDCRKTFDVQGEWSWTWVPAIAKTRSRNFSNPLELEDWRAESRTSAVNRDWDFVWEGSKPCASGPPHPLPDNVCLKE